METGKLHNFTYTLMAEDLRLKYADRVTAIINAITQIGANQGNVQITNDQSKEIDDALVWIGENSISLNDYDTKLLCRMDLDKWFGIPFKNMIMECFSKATYSTQLQIQGLNKLVASRKSAIDNIKTLQGCLETLNIDVQFYKDHFDFGLIIPTSNNSATTRRTISALKEWEFAVKIFNEINGSPCEDVVISYVERGSLGFHFAIDPETAKTILVVVKDLLAAFAAILQIKKLRGELKSRGIKDETIKNIENEESDMLSRNIESIAERIISEKLKDLPSEGRKNELKAGVNHSVNKMSNLITEGVTFEVIPPEYELIEVSKDASEDEKAIQEKRIEDIKQSVEVVKGYLREMNSITVNLDDIKVLLPKSEQPEE